MTTIRCPHCGTVNRAGSNYCNHCGTELPAESRPLATEPVPPIESAPVPEQHLPEPTELATVWPAEQPWLRPEPPHTEETTAPAEDATARRLVSNVQGLLDPIRLFSSDELTESEAIRSLPLVAPLPLEGAQVRRLRTLLTTLPRPEELGIRVQLSRLPDLRIPWVFWLLGLAIGLPIFLALPGPLGAPRLWPGVTEAYLTIEDLSPGSPVLLLWAYDPATANEMDLLAEPLVLHLLERQVQPIVVTLLPGGPATARRLFTQAREHWYASQNLRLRASDAPQLEVHYLTGGPAALPLLGQNLSVGLSGQLVLPEFQSLRSAAPTHVLTVVIADDASAVQQAIEQLHALTQTPLLAFTGAGADPVLRPYWDSGQLRGLVSGFDGAYGYQALRAQAGSNSPGPDLSTQVVAQNWGHLALLALILAGNLAVLLGRNRDQ